MDAKELKTQIRNFTTGGNNLRRPMSVKELTTLKDYLNQLKAILSEEE